MSIVDALQKLQVYFSISAALLGRAKNSFN